MLDVLAEADAAGVRADGDAVLGRHQHDREHLVHAADAAGVDLADVDRLRLEELLEDDAVLDDLPGRDPDRRDRLPDPRVTEDVVGARRLLDPPGVELREHAHRRDRLVHAPDLVRVHHQRRRRRRGRRGSAPRGGRRRRGPAPPSSSRGGTRLRSPAARAPRPSRRRSRASRPRSCTPGSPSPGAPARRSSPPAAGAEELDGLVRVEDVVDVPEVDRGDELLRIEVRRAAARAVPRGSSPRGPRPRSRPRRPPGASTPFSGPSQRSWPSDTSERQKERMSPVIPSRLRPTTSGSSARMAATQTSVPRPHVKVSPWPESSSSESVCRTT